ncbi:hypothetical protein DYS74_01225 [Sinirhodobacter hankyongi]|uniref:Uncharacterized protein n=2 Tax=Paenirhodobacter hankyongi TaxID=2294033 RepID=A0A421BXF4_9RHOB|nr:hypothetical protein DYS74_01225 [Sinirhodobacter hankyongi]
MHETGFEVAQALTLAEARIRARLLRPGVVVAGLFPGEDAEAGESALGLILTMQAHTPDLMTILLTDSPLFAHGELFDMLGSLRCVLAETIAAEDLAEVVRHLLARGPGLWAVPHACLRCRVADQCHDAAAVREGEEAGGWSCCIGCGRGV